MLVSKIELGRMELKHAYCGASFVNMIVKTKAEYYFKMVVGKHPYLFPRDYFLTCSFGKKHLFVSIVWGRGGDTKKKNKKTTINQVPPREWRCVL